ncbi:hypothetical protein CDAR_203951 [Caerostris darwini]|uniref:Uncharacterized protein n=1 Tax=Caerostris darwini TaxID=1538125 RepID=A0AAV4RNL1_9ARAC|nr:hypothetical protein CDAR_203951 [Caerostris darwini]
MILHVTRTSPNSRRKLLHLPDGNPATTWIILNPRRCKRGRTSELLHTLLTPQSRGTSNDILSTYCNSTIRKFHIALLDLFQSAKRNDLFFQRPTGRDHPVSPKMDHVS